MDQHSRRHKVFNLKHSCSCNDREVSACPPINNAGVMQVLVKTNVTRYLEFKAVDGSFVVNANKVEKVPATAMEALKSPLMGFFEKRRAAKFFRCLKTGLLLLCRCRPTFCCTIMADLQSLWLPKQFGMLQCL